MLLKPFAAVIAVCLTVVFSAQSAEPLTYEGGDGIGKGKHIVLLAGDHEYRSEETIPAFARVLSKHHGFKCTVLFNIDPETGEIVPGNNNMPGLEALDTADLAIVFLRFQDFPDDQMKHFDDYMKRGGPIVGLRTSTHAFKIPEGKTYSKYSWDYKGEDYLSGWGHQVLGQSWVGHYGKNHQQSTRISVVEAKSDHPILRGVKNAWVEAGGYVGKPTDGDILTTAQPLNGMTPDSPIDETKEPQPSEWTRTYTSASGKEGRVFASQYGASEDLQNDGYRRLLLNGSLWAIGLEDEITPDLKADLVGPYKPNTFGNGRPAKGVKPEAYAGFESQIPANNDVAPKKPKSPKKKEVKESAAAKKSLTTGKPAQFVRIALPGKKRILTLAEVEVMSGGKNVAPQGKATQSSVGAGGVPERAIDGNKDSDWGKNGQTHTNGGGEDNPWWEVDLGKEVQIDEVKITNRKSFEDRLNQFTLEFLDADRKPVFRVSEVATPEVMSINAKGKLGYLTYAGKAGKPAEKRKSGRPSAPETPAPELVDVPDGYRDELPFAFQKGDTVAILGNGLPDRMQHDGWMETLLQSELVGQEVNIRNMSLSGDRPNSYPRSKGFTHMTDYLRHVKADVVFAFFGYNESFDGVEKAGDYQKLLVDFVKTTRGSKANGESFPRIVLFSPIAHEDLESPNFPDGKSHNERLAAYTAATKAAAEEAGVEFVDLFTPSQKLFEESEQKLTINGVHLTDEGNRLLGEVIASDLLGKSVSSSDSMEPLRQAVIEKSEHWHNRYRARDGNDVWGSRSTLKFVNDQTNAEVLQHELTMLDTMTADRDALVWASARGEDITIDDSNVPAPVPVISNVGGGSKSSNAMKEGNLNYVSGEQGLEHMAVPEGFEMNLFADESRFPELVNPVQMQVDTKGRLWAAVWPTYPKWEPLKEMNDALLIVHDDDKDGSADRVTEFARVQNPLGFEFWNGGVIVNCMPDILFLEDTDGDDVADKRTVILQGLGSSDTHHAANNFIMGPDGAVYWQSGIFLQHNHEHPWGPSLQTTAAGLYRFDPRQYTISFHAANSPNSHGTAFDGWGYQYATDGTSGRAFQVRPDGKGFKMHPLLEKEVRPVTASEVVSSAHFPDEMQGDFLIFNTIGFLGIKQYDLARNEADGSVWGEPSGAELTVTLTANDGTQTEDTSRGLLMSGDKNFRPTDGVFGEDGALYISDWYNVIIGHMQHNVRDPNRDHQHGRIYRMTAKDRPLQKPVAIDGEPIAALLDHLKSPVDGIRQRTRLELSERDSAEVIAATQEWMKQFDPEKKEDAHHLLEALWVHQQHNSRNVELLGQLLKSPEPHARHAAGTVQHIWFNIDESLRGGVVEGEKMEKAKKSGILSDTNELTKIRIATIPERMMYDTKELTVKAGKKIELLFANPDFMPHNILLLQPGTEDAVAMEAMALGAKGFEMQFIPENDNIIWASKLLDNGQEETIEFNAPTKPGAYPYICSFPGHHVIMRGILHVK